MDPELEGHGAIIGNGSSVSSLKAAHPRLKRYVETCTGHCVLKNLRRQNHQLHKMNFNASHFDAVVSTDDDSACRGTCGAHG